MIPLSRPDLGDEETDAAVAVLRSGNLVQGERVLHFEGALAERLGKRHVIAVSSGTAALHLTMLVLGIGHGDEVIVPSFTFPATANAVELAGGTPVLCDVDPVTCNIDASLIPALITRRTKAIMPVHEFGRPADLDQICAIAQEHQLPLVEDAACAMGATWKNRPCGSFGLLACFSFHPRKVLTTGEGGAIITDNDDFADRLRLLRNHGIDRKGTEVDFVCAGFNYRMTDIQAAIGSVQLRRLDAMIAVRRQLAARYATLLKDLPGVLPSDPQHGQATYQTYHVVLASPGLRDRAFLALRHAMIGCGNGATDLSSTTHHRRFATQPQPGARRAYGCGLALPLWLGMTAGEQARIADVLLTALAGGA